MNSILISLIIFACVFGGSLFGLFLRTVLPGHHLSDDAKEAVKLGAGLVATDSSCARLAYQLFKRLF